MTSGLQNHIQWVEMGSSHGASNNRAAMWLGTFLCLVFRPLTALQNSMQVMRTRSCLKSGMVLSL